MERSGPCRIFTNPREQRLVTAALDLGADRACLLPAGQIRVKEDLAAFCLTCPNFRQAASCPPRVAGPGQFRIWIRENACALFFKIRVPADHLATDRRLTIFRRLHEMTARIEARALEKGFEHATGFAGGSCKPLFCADHEDCAALAGRCRFPEKARPSMSGFGIDVARLIETAGWEKESFLEGEDLPEAGMAGVFGLVLVR